jgi:hypothetical protein
MANAIDDNIRSAIEAFVEDLAELVRQSALESVEAVFGGEGVTRTTRRPGRPRKTAGAARAAGGRRKGQKRSPAEIQELQNRLLAAITKTPGQRKEQLGAALGASSKDLMLVTNKLLADGAIRKRGVKRATKYYAR